MVMTSRCSFTQGDRQDGMNLQRSYTHRRAVIHTYTSMGPTCHTYGLYCQQLSIFLLFATSKDIVLREPVQELNSFNTLG